MSIRSVARLLDTDGRSHLARPHGGSVPTRELLEFGLAHARARDAVRTPFDQDGLIADLESTGLKAIALGSAATSRDEFLRRPDLGRRLTSPVERRGTQG